MKANRIGLDLAKNLFQVHGVDTEEQVIVRRQIRRRDMLRWFAKQDRTERCVVAMEACCGADYWARELQKMGYEARIINPSFVKPYVKGNKNDARDAEAICEAASRPAMRYVPVKTEEQQDLALLHRQREQLIKRRTALVNQTRGMLMNYGITVEKRATVLRRELPMLIEATTNSLTPVTRRVFQVQYNELNHLDARIDELDRELEQIASGRADTALLLSIPGIGPITATAFVAHIGDGSQFQNGRQCSAYLGMVPAQYSSGGKERLSGISKRGNRYLRTMLIHGARSALQVSKKKIAANREMSRRDYWLCDLEQRSHHNIAAVALANKNARIAWALLTTGACYREAV